MGKVAQIVMGPAGSGKSTYCRTMLQHSQTIKRSFHLVNLDPAADKFEYEPTIDIRQLIDLEDAMEELELGPNGGLVYCMEFLVEHLDWLEEQLQEYHDDYLVIDCPGQIELYSHFTIMKAIVEMLVRLDYKVCGMYLLDCQFMQDTPKFFAGVMTAMSAMLQLEAPHINVMTKMDLLESSDNRNLQQMERFFDVDSSLLLDAANSDTRPRFHALNEALVRLIDEYSMVSFIPLNIKDEDSIALLLDHIDHAVQYGEDMEPKEPDDLNDDLDE